MLPLLALSFLACTSPADDTGAGGLCSSGDCPPIIGVIDHLPYAGPDENGVSLGMDLDHYVTTESDSEGCGKTDYVDPEGVEGIDNGFAALMPLLKSTEAVALEGLIQDAIDSGALLLLFQLDGVDDIQDDPQVDLTVWHGAGEPLLGTDGHLEPGQTFDKDLTLEPAVVPGLALVDGRVQAQGLELQIALQVLNAAIDLHFHEGGFRVELAEDGTATGFLTGGVELDDILSIAETAGIDESLRTALIALLGVSADVFPDESGACQGISMVFEHHAIPAWFYEE